MDVSWYLQGRILYSPGSPLREDIIARNRLALSIMESEGQPPHVHLLIDHTNSFHPPESLKGKTLSYYVNIGDEEVRQKFLEHQLLGWIISIATPTAMKTAGAVISQQRNYRWHSVDTLEEALIFLKERDGSLGDLPTDS